MFRFENAWLFFVSIGFVMMTWLVPKAVYERFSLSYRAKYIIATVHPILTAFVAIFLILFMSSLFPYKDRLISRIHLGMYGVEHGACVNSENEYWRLHPPTFDKIYHSGNLVLLMRLDNTEERFVFHVVSDCPASRYVVKTPIKANLAVMDVRDDLDVCMEVAKEQCRLRGQIAEVDEADAGAGASLVKYSSVTIKRYGDGGVSFSLGHDDKLNWAAGVIAAGKWKCAGDELVKVD